MTVSLLLQPPIYAAPVLGGLLASLLFTGLIIHQYVSPRLPSLGHLKDVCNAIWSHLGAQSLPGPSCAGLTLTL